MDKTNIMFLGNGATVKIDGEEVGYTRGISWKPEREVENYKNQKVKGFIGRGLLSISATIKIGMLEVTDDNIALSLVTQADDSFHSLELTGKLKNDKELTLTFYQVKVEDSDEVTLGKEESVIGITFRAFIDEDEGEIGEYTLT